MRYMKAQCIGGPRDGAIFYVTVPPREEVNVYAKDDNGRQWQCRYRRAPNSEGDIITFAASDFDKPGPRSDVLERAFVGKRTVRYLPVDQSAPGRG